MTGAFKYPGIVDYDVVYVDDVKGVALGQGNSGKRTVLLDSTDFCDVISESAENIAKAWTKEDLIIWLTSNYQVENYLEQRGVSTIEISFKVNEGDYSGTATSGAEAIAILTLLS